MTSLTSKTAHELRKGLLAKEFSATEVVKAHLDRIEDTNPKLNSFITVTGESAIEQAKKADDALASEGENTPLLTGVPVGIKDILVTEGVKTTCGSKILQEFVPPYTSTAVNRLQQKGAIVIGKTNLDEFAMGSSNENSAFGDVVNPVDSERVPGGSSGGSAVCVASGQAPISLGTDTGGSIRQPASFTGVYGFKPTYGRVSRYGLVAFASSLDQVGPFARSVEDIAVCMDSISGFDENDSTSLKSESTDLLSSLLKTDKSFVKGLRVGIPKEFESDNLQDEIRNAVNSTVEVLKGMGAEIVPVSLPHTKYAIGCYYVINPAEASSNLSRYDGVRYGQRAKDAETLFEMYENTRSSFLGPEVKRRILVGNFVLSSGYYDAYYKKAQQVRSLIQKDYLDAFSNKCDVILAPTAPNTAFKLGENKKDHVAMYFQDIFTLPANLAGIPGLSMPVGKDSNNLPIGAQLFAPPMGEEKILNTAKAISDEINYNCSEFAQ